MNKAMKQLLRGIAFGEPFWVLAAAPILLLPDRFIPDSMMGTTSTLQPYAMLALGIGWPIRWLAYGRPTRLTPITIPILLLLLWLPVNYWAAADKKLALDSLGYLLLGIALYFAFINWPPTQRHPQRLAWFILIIGLGLALSAPFLSNLALNSLYQLPGLAPFFQKLTELTPGNVNENRMAGTLVIMLPLFTILFFRRQQPVWWRLFNGLGMVIILALLVFSQSRGALLAAAFGFGLLIIVRWPRLSYLIPFVLIGFGYFVYLVGPTVFLAAQSADNPLGGFDIRLEILNRTLYALADFPFTGVGIGNFPLVIPILYPYFLIPPDVVVEHSHNIFTQVAVDLGFPGLIAYLAIHLTVMGLLLKIVNRRDGSLRWYLAAGVFTGLAIMFIHGLIDAPVWGAKPAFIAWLLVALAVLLGLNHHDTAPQ
jgi:putative inorganic carbon (HCO3(-)) transporter